MKVRILPSSPDAVCLQYLISFVVDGRLAIDAGCLGLCGTPLEQAAVTNLILTHSHADHIYSLPIFAMNVWDATGRGITVHAPEPVLDTLRRDVFNWRVWPDFTALRHEGRPMVTLVPLALGQAVDFDGLSVTAVPVNHPVPTVAYVVEDGSSAVLFAVDTGPTSEAWNVAGAHPRLKAALVDAAFPDNMEELASITGHLTPRLLGEQIQSLPAHVECLAVHLKPAFRDRIAEDLEREPSARVSIGRIGHDYLF